MSRPFLGKAELNIAETVAYSAAVEVAPTLKENFGKSEFATKSSESDWVTQWDTLAEERIIEKLRVFDTEANVGFLGEESGVTGNSEVYWTIDPIDGTSGFVRGIDNCTTMISLVEDERPVVGVIYDFIRNDLYTAIEGQGAYKNLVQPLQVSQRNIGAAHIDTYVPDDEQGSRIVSQIRSVGGFVIGSSPAGHMFTNIARGATEGFVGFNNPYATVWDYAPGALLVQEAGGTVQNTDGTEYTVDNSDLIAANYFTFKVLRNIVGNAN